MTRSAQTFLSEKTREFRDDLIQVAVKFAPDVTLDESHLQQAVALLRSPASPEVWSILNRCRVHLIRRELADGHFQEAERELLEILQDFADRYVAQVAPRPFEELRRLEDELHQGRADSEEPDQQR